MTDYEYREIKRYYPPFAVAVMKSGERRLVAKYGPKGPVDAAGRQLELRWVEKLTPYSSVGEAMAAMRESE